MTKKELIEILKKKASASYEISKDYEGQNEKMAYGLKKEAWTLQSVIDMLEDNKNRIKKNDMLTAYQMTDVACKWLDYHHSNYIVNMQYGAIVSGACQTDLRAFLNSAKKMEYWDAINAAKS